MVTGTNVSGKPSSMRRARYHLLPHFLPPSFLVVVFFSPVNWELDWICSSQKAVVAYSIAFESG